MALYVMVIYEYLEHVGLFTWSSLFIPLGLDFVLWRPSYKNYQKLNLSTQKKNYLKSPWQLLIAKGYLKGLKLGLTWQNLNDRHFAWMY